MNLKKRGILLFVALAGLFIAMNYLDLDTITSMTVADTAVDNYVSESNKPPDVYFCPRDNCSDHLIEFIEDADKIHCALFDLDLEPLIDTLRENNAQVVIDNNNYEEEFDFARKDTSGQLSHNKFCIFDDSIVWTGSFNPTFRGNNKNNNNVIVFYSDYLAKNYEAEFQELWNSQFGKGAQVENDVVLINNMKIENYFCPEDWCANKVLRVLEGAEKSIYFMVFSFTHDGIGDMLVKKHNLGVEVKGVMEKSQNNAYAEFDKLNQSGVDISWDHNKANMHHKVFIIDKKIVVTGSFNPTKNGDTNNDENVVIVYDDEIARNYLEEFELMSK